MLSPDELLERDWDDDLLRTSLDPDYVAANGPPHALYDRLRRERPIAQVRRASGSCFWLLTRQAEIREVLRQDPRVFSNMGDISINLDDDYSGGKTFALPSLLNMDPPIHKEHRGVLTPRFRTGVVAALDEAFITETVRRLLDEHMGDARGEADMVEITEKLSIAAVARILGLPEDSWAQGFRLANALANSSDPAYRLGDSPSESRKLAGEGLWQMFTPVVNDRIRCPGEDLTSVLVRAKVGGCPLEFGQILTHAALVFLGGVETTRNVMTIGAYDLAARPKAWDQVRESGNVILLTEELIRWVSPINHFARTLTEDRTVGGVEMKKGDLVALCFASANRDEAVFETPHEIIVDRSPNPHVGFGLGEHLCLGNNLARAQARTMFRELTTRFRRLERTVAPERPRSGNLNGYSRCVLAYERA